MIGRRGTAGSDGPTGKPGPNGNYTVIKNSSTDASFDVGIESNLSIKVKLFLGQCQSQG